MSILPKFSLSIPATSDKMKLSTFRSYLAVALVLFAATGCNGSGDGSSKRIFSCQYGFGRVAFRFDTREDLEVFEKNDCTELVNDSLRIYHIAGVKNLSQLSRLQSVSSGIEIGYAEDLESLDGLEKNNHAWSISLVHNPKLTDISALSNIEGPVDNQLTDFLVALNIADNDRLETLDGLPPIARYKGWIYIEENDRLRSLSGLDALQGFAPAGEYDEPNRVIIRNNRSLPTCEAEAFVARLENVDEAIIEGNDDSARCD